MKSRLLLPTFAVIATAAVSFGMNAFAQSFTEPASAPPSNNAEAPLDVGGSPQTKEAGLAVNTGVVVNGQLLTAPVGLDVPYGNVGIGTTSPATSLGLDVNGNVGASAYCDENGNNCVTPAALSGGGGSPTTVAGIGIASCQVYQNTYGHLIFLLFATGGAGGPNGWASAAEAAPGGSWINVGYASDSNSSADGTTMTIPIPSGYSYQVCYQNARYARIVY